MESNNRGRNAGLAVFMAMLMGMFLLIAIQGTTLAKAQATGSANRSAQVVPAEESETPGATETHQAETTETPEATETHEVEPTETWHPEMTETPEASETPEVEPTESAEPEETETPEASETPEIEPTETVEPEGTPSSIANLSIPGSGSRTFPVTGKTVKGVFLQRWDSSGGLMQQGYPISSLSRERSALNGKTYTMQYFERAVFEYHPENAAPYNVLLSQLGTFRYKAKYQGNAPGQKASTSPGSVLFKETGHRVGGVFLSYWLKNGGVAQQGYPISDEFQEKSDLNGQTYTVQYFERAVFEYHPENPAPYNVLLTQLGTLQYQQKSGGR